MLLDEWEWNSARIAVGGVQQTCMYQSKTGAGKDFHYTNELDKEG